MFRYKIKIMHLELSKRPIQFGTQKIRIKNIFSASIHIYCATGITGKPRTVVAHKVSCPETNHHF
jgi:hypothetical protein